MLADELLWRIREPPQQFQKQSGRPKSVCEQLGMPRRRDIVEKWDNYEIISTNNGLEMSSTNGSSSPEM